MAESCSFPLEAYRFEGDEEDWDGCVCILPIGHESDHKCAKRVKMECEAIDDELWAIIVRENNYHGTWPVSVRDFQHATP